MNPRGRNRSRVKRQGDLLLVELCQDEVFEATRNIAGSEFNKYPIDVPEIAELAPAFEDIIVHADLENDTSAFTWKTVLERRYRTTWVENDADLTTISGTTGMTIGSAFSNRGKFGRFVRPAIYTQVSAGGSGTHYGELSVTLAIRLWR
jgi:hypothetical protein